MTIRTWLLFLMMRLLGGRWFPVTGPSILVISGLIMSDRAERIQQVIRPLDLRVIVLPPPARVEAVITDISRHRAA